MEENVGLKAVQLMKVLPRLNRRHFYSYVQDNTSSTCELLNERTVDKRSFWKRREAFCLRLACHRHRPIAEIFRPPICQALAFSGGSGACLWVVWEPKKTA